MNACVTRDVKSQVIIFSILLLLLLLLLLSLLSSSLLSLFTLFFQVRCLGGIKVFLPLFAQVDQPLIFLKEEGVEVGEEGEEGGAGGGNGPDTEFMYRVFSCLQEMLRGSDTNQHEIWRFFFFLSFFLPFFIFIDIIQIFSNFYQQKKDVMDSLLLVSS